MKSRCGWLVAVVLVAATASTAFAELTKEQAEALRLAREQACERLAKLQREDGSWRLDPDHAGPWDAAFTALATHAMARTYVFSTRKNVQQGLAWISQHVHDGKPLADGLETMCLGEANGEGYRRSLGLRLKTLVAARIRAGDPADSLFIVGGLDALKKAGAQIPEATWQQARKDFLDAQNEDGSWTSPPWIEKGGFLGASGETDRHLATVAALAALHTVRDGLRKEGDEDKELDAAIDKALDWLAKNPKKEYSPFESYAIKRLGRASGYGDFDGKPWRPVVRDAMIKRIADEKTSPTDLAFALLALRDADVPAVMGKLKTRGDWDAYPDDVRHLVDDYICNRFSMPITSEIISLQTDADYLSTIPVLYLSGSRALDFTADEKKKLKDYVDNRGTLLAVNTGDGDAFDKSLRALVAELWPGWPFGYLDRKHAIFNMPRPMTKDALDVQVRGLVLPGEKEPVGMLYVDMNGPIFARLLSQGGKEARPALDLGTNIYFYAMKSARRRAATDAPAE